MFFLGEYVSELVIFDELVDFGKTNKGSVILNDVKCADLFTSELS